MIDRYEDNVSPVAEPDSVIERARTRSVRIGAAVDIKHDRPFATVTQSGCKYVEEQAIFAYVAAAGLLWRGSPIVCSITDAIPFFGRKRSHKTSRRSIRAVTYALKTVDLVISISTELAIFCSSDRRFGLPKKRM